MVRWRRIMEAAATQCGRAILPGLERPRVFKEIIETRESQYTLLLTLTEESQPLEPHLRHLRDAPEVIVMIGPEGDFSPEEIAAAKRQGVHAVRLGRLTLRSETAAIATVAILQHSQGTL